MSMFFLLRSRIEYRYTYHSIFVKFLMFIMNVTWFFAFLITTTVAFLPILPRSLFAPVIAAIPFEVTKLGVLTGLGGIALYLIFATVGLLGMLKEREWLKSVKKKQVILYILAIAIPLALAFALTRVLNLGNGAILMLTSTFTYVSYLGASMRLALPLMEDEEDSLARAMRMRGCSSFDALKGRLSQAQQHEVVITYNNIRNQIQQYNEQVNQSNNKTMQKAINFINAVHIVYIIAAIAVTVLLVVSAKREEIGRIWGSLLIYAPAVVTVIKIISNIAVIFKKRKAN